MKLCHVVAGMLFILAAVGVPARAAEAPDPAHTAALKTADEATELYKSHDYRRAIEKFVEAFASDPDPNLIFNIARCYDALGDTPAAIEKYELFLSKPGGDVNGRRKAEEALTRLRKKKDPPPSVPTSAPAASDVQAAPTATPVPQTRSESSSPSSTLRLTGLVAGAAGIIGLGVGTAYGLSARSKNNQAAALCSGSECQSADAITLTNDARDRATVSSVAFVAGTTLLVGGALLYLLAPTSRSPTALHVTPQVGTNAATVSLTGGW